MLILIISVALGLLTILAISLQRTYSRIPKHELKRRAAQGDELANALYRAVAFGASLHILLWGLIGLFSATFFVLVSTQLAPPIAALIVLVVLWFGYAWLPRTKATKVGNRLARMAAPSLAALLNHLYPLLNRFAEWLKTRGRLHIHTGLFDKDDLLHLLSEQQKQNDNRLSEQEVALVRGALTYSDKLISEVMTPRRAVKVISASDTIGPILMNELHDSGFSRFPVYKEKQDNIVGTLHLRDLVAVKEGGSVSSLMEKRVFYVRDEQTLEHALQAFLKTKHHLFIVVNNFEEFVGVITIEDVLEEILGKQIVDEFDKYDDMRAVAQLEAKRASKHRTGKPLE